MTDVIHYPTPPEPTPMTAKQYLSQARTLDGEIGCKLEQIARLEAQLTRCTQAISDMPGGGAHDWTETAARVIELKNEIRADVDRLTALKREIRAAIAAVENPTYRQLLELRYLRGWGWQQVADELHYGRTTIWRLHKKALRGVKISKS